MIGPFGCETDKIMLETMFCGKVETDVIKAELRDPFSLVKKRCKAVSKGHFYIYPKDMDIISDDALKQRTHSSKMENYLGRKGNDPTEILDIRQCEDDPLEAFCKMEEENGSGTGYALEPGYSSGVRNTWGADRRFD